MNSYLKYLLRRKVYIALIVVYFNFMNRIALGLGVRVKEGDKY
ncbi:hypothetical protein [Aciduliprofundum sp. MAR08-339]